MANQNEHNAQQTPILPLSNPVGRLGSEGKACKGSLRDKKVEKAVLLFHERREEKAARLPAQQLFESQHPPEGCRHATSSVVHPVPSPLKSSSSLKDVNLSHEAENGTEMGKITIAPA